MSTTVGAHPVDDTLAANKAVVRAWFAALSAGHLDDAWALMDPAGDYWVLRQRVAMPVPQFATVYGEHMENTFVDGLQFTVGELTAEDDRVAAIAEGKAQLRRGAPYENLYHFLFVLRGGRIRHVREYADTYQSWRAFSADAPSGDG
jgi:ketosteroid isomerase-like protein